MYSAFLGFTYELMLMNSVSEVVPSCFSVWCCQPCSLGALLFQNWHQPSASLTQAAEGEVSLQSLTTCYFISILATNTQIFFCSLSMPPQINSFFEFNERLEAILTKAFIYRSAAAWWFLTVLAALLHFCTILFSPPLYSSSERCLPVTQINT